MKTKLVLLLAIAVVAPSLQAEDTPAITANATNQFQIAGMSCTGCAQGITSELKRLPGVASAEVTFRNKLAIVAYDTNRVSAARVKKAIIEAGYEAKLIKPRKAKRH